MKAAQINEEFDKAVDEMIADAKEKEPAPSANDASPKEVTSKEDNHLSHLNDTTKEPESQAITAIAGIKMMMEVEALLAEVFDGDAQIIGINANSDHCDIGFTYHGREYSMLFAEREEVPSYGNDKH